MRPLYKITLENEAGVVRVTFRKLPPQFFLKCPKVSLTVELVIVHINKNQNYQTGISHPDSSPNAAGPRLLAICPWTQHQMTGGQTSQHLHWPLLPRSTWRPPRAAWTPPCQWLRCCQCPLAWGNIITFISFIARMCCLMSPTASPSVRLPPILEMSIIISSREIVPLLSSSNMAKAWTNSFKHCWWDQKRRLWYAERRGDTVR